MSGTHDKLQHGNKFHHCKFSDLVLDINYFSFSHHNPCPNPIYLLKHEFLSPNNQFYQRIWYVEYYSVHAYMVTKILNPGPVSSEISDLCEISDLSLFLCYFACQNKKRKFGKKVRYQVPTTSYQR